MFDLGGYEENLYTEIGCLDSAEDMLRRLGDKDIAKYRLKTIVSGDYLESEGYPLWNTKKTDLKAIGFELKKSSRPCQVELNHTNRMKNTMRLLNANFDSSCLLLGFGYAEGKEPDCHKRAKMNITNYLKRLKRYIKNNNLPKLKYYHVIEQGSKCKRWHHHVVVNFGDRDVAEKLWTLGEYPQSRYLVPDDKGFEKLADYLSKDLRGTKSYYNSTGLIRPWVNPKVADSKMSRAKAAKIAKKEIDVVELYEKKLYPGWKLVSIDSKYSPFCAGVYLSVRMRKLTKKEIKERERSVRRNAKKEKTLYAGNS